MGGKAKIYLSLITLILSGVYVGAISLLTPGPEGALNPFFWWAVLPYFVYLIPLVIIVRRKNISSVFASSYLFASCGCLLFSILAYTEMYTSSSSTAALGFIFYPLYSLAGFAILFIFTAGFLIVFIRKGR